MIYTITVKCKKSSAWFLFFILYLQLVSPVLAGKLNSYSNSNYSTSSIIPVSKNIYFKRSIDSEKYKVSTPELNVSRIKLLKNKNQLSLEKSIRFQPKEKLNVSDLNGPGPSQPEMQSFQSVNGKDLVDLFTGNFSYNIPLLDVGGYPVNIHYNSGITMDQESSWVGLGWNINPGTINRNLRGLPDDFNGQDSISKTTSIKSNVTFGITAGANAELLGKTIKKEKDTGKANTIGISLGVFHNTYNGWGTETGINAGINSGRGSKGYLSGGLSITNNSQTGLDVSPSLSFRLSKEDAKTQGFITIGTNYNSRMGVQALQMTTQIRKQRDFSLIKDDQVKVISRGITGGIVSEISFATPSYTPAITLPFTSEQFTFTGKLGGEKWTYHENFYIQGNYSRQFIKEEEKTKSLPAYGYLYYQEAKQQQNVLLDFNREKDVAFRGTTPTIAIPTYTYDFFSIAGEGIGGMFRPYRGDIGVIYDHEMSTKSTSGKLSIDLGFGSIFHGGVDLNKVSASTKNTPWRRDNVMARYIGFKEQDSLYENVYFKNPGEKVNIDLDYYDKIGDDKLVRVELSPKTGQNSEIVSATRNLNLFKNARQIGTVGLDASAIKSQRDKRTQVITYHTAAEASVIGLDKDIKSFNINSFPSTSCNTNYQLLKRIDEHRKGHHLSEILVLNTEGKKYVYGIPAYNIIQEDVTFSVDKSGGNNNSGLVNYTAGVDNHITNKKGKDNYYNKEIIPPYAHSFLLSSIVSPNYVDLTQDGITEDDNGDAIKFNYSRIYGGSDIYKWRAPFDQGKAAYNEGLKSYNRDDKGSYSYGEKEVWYMNSIESKTMIATFVLETDSIREDSYGVTGRDGGRANKKLYRLKKINLYTKSDFLKNGTVAKPIKSVHFDYSYELCNGVPSSNNTGKLTLKKIWFSYNNNYKGKRNPYIFKYHIKNPNFDNKSYDRWGNYKNPDDNPGTIGNTLTNGEYPYTLQKGVKGWDSTKAATNVAAWTLNEIKLPSGGIIKVSYESDDYGYVQHKRAMRMFSIAGLGLTPEDPLSPYLYQPNKTDKDYLCVFVKLPEPISNKDEITARYLEGINKLYFKLFVKMPDDNWGSGYDQIPCFADILDYGIKPAYGNNMIWIKVASVKSKSPFATSAIQFMRLNLPGKAYPFSEPGDDVKLKDVIGMLVSKATNIKNAINGFENEIRNKNFCNQIDTAKSFVRLQQPDLMKLGGGLRVKRIEVLDNWQRMSTKAESSYGQTYSYKTSKLINNIPTTISSGVASYEPVLGKDENPFFQPIEYAEKMAALGPTDFTYIEEPLGESFFPSPGIGYSKVSVQTIHSSKKSANGIEVTEFYTAKDFPTIYEHTPLDNESKKTFANPIGNFFKFDAKRYITLSQGFKVELNDMHGKLKSQSSFSQNDLKNPFNYVYNYYKLDKNTSLNNYLSNKVITADASGNINNTSQMGKDIDILVDIREQTSTTSSGSVQLNVDVATPIIILPSIPRLPTFETNRYRSIAVTKVINRYGILDSVVSINKGSKISNTNMVYDGETGNVLLSRTQNEFNDPVYTFSYPAYWAHSGMGPAYKNVGGVFKNVSFNNGVMDYKGLGELELKKYFESGDELLLFGDIKLKGGSPECLPVIYSNKKDTSVKIWAIDVSKATGGFNGIYFIDKDGLPITARAKYVKIIRSGKRNLTGVSGGTIMSLNNPVKFINGVNKLIFDSTTSVINANAIQFKDVWSVDSSNYRKDSIIRNVIPVYEICSNKSGKLLLKTQESFGILSKDPPGIISEFKVPSVNQTLFETYSRQSSGSCNNSQKDYLKSYLRFDMSVIPKGSIITKAEFKLYAPPFLSPQINGKPGISNSAVISRIQGPWVRDILDITPPFPSNLRRKILDDYFKHINNGSIDLTTQISVDNTPLNINTYRNDVITDVKTLTQTLLDNYHNSNIRGSVVLSLTNLGECSGAGFSSMGYSMLQCSNNNATNAPCPPAIEICYIAPCSDGSTPVYLTSPVPGYYCYGESVDTFICKPNINDTATNPYRWGIWGNWQNDKNFVYYNLRTDSLASTITNIRKNGVINNFIPFWSFGSDYLTASQDVSRWVWNNEIKSINTKGLEIQNRDALDRYNSAQYGYNQTLPVAVSQNSRNREMMFDSFEDYNYRSDTCKSCPTNRFIDLVTTGKLVDTISHSGLHSLRVEGNQSNSVIIPVSTIFADTISPKISGKTSSTNVIRTVVNGTGNGLNAKYFSLFGNVNQVDNNINFNWGTATAINNNTHFRDNFIVTWTGWIQPKFSETYTFYGSADDKMQVNINNVRISANTILESTISSNVKLAPITLIAGQLYNITVIYHEIQNYAHAKLEWSSPSQSREVIPQNQLYTINSAPNTVTTTNILCTRLDSLKPIKVSLPRFSPLQGSSLVIGAWVKERNNNPDTVTTLRSVQMQIVFDNGPAIIIKPSGNIIEGWQRIEDIISVPANAQQMTLSLKSSNSSVPVYFDDVRVHPFNSLLKSYVYNPVNLRLMAELDENNYASFYEYDDDGTLIRVKKETMKGIKTIKETRSALIKE